MSITDELRAWVKEHFSHNYFIAFADCILAIADRIDVEYERGMADAFETRNSDENLESDGWIRLPKDADGVPIRPGDVMECAERSRYKVAGYAFEGGNLIPLDEYWMARERRTSRHHKPPTVEDVLREFGDWYAHTKGGCDEDGIIAEYAAKLRLSEGE